MSNLYDESHNSAARCPLEQYPQQEDVEERMSGMHEAAKECSHQTPARGIHQHSHLRKNRAGTLKPTWQHYSADDEHGDQSAGGEYGSKSHGQKSRLDPHVGAIPRHGSPHSAVTVSSSAALRQP